LTVPLARNKVECTRLKVSYQMDQADADDVALKGVRAARKRAHRTQRGRDVGLVAGGEDPPDVSDMMKLMSEMWGRGYGLDAAEQAEQAEEAAEHQKNYKWPLSMILRARELWVAGVYGGDTGVGQQLDVPAVTIRAWRTKRMPDGASWEMLREGSPLELAERAGGDWAWEIKYRRRAIPKMLAAQEWLLSYLGPKAYVDKEGNPVEQVYDRASGEAIPLRGVIPITVDETQRMLLTCQKLIEAQFAGLAAYRTNETRVREEVAEIVRQVLQQVQLNDDQQRQLRMMLVTRDYTGSKTEGLMILGTGGIVAQGVAGELAEKVESGSQDVGEGVADPKAPGDQDDC